MVDEAQLQEMMKELVVARLRSSPPNLGIIIGDNSLEPLTPSELIKQIENDTEVGQEYVELELDFLRALKDGLLYA